MCMSELQILRWRESLISSQFLFEVNASDTNVLMNPFDFACAYLVLLLPVKSEVVSISVNCDTHEIQGKSRELLGFS